MSALEVRIVEIEAIEDHPDADALEIARIGGYRSIVKIGEYRAGDRVAYIPEDSVVPEAVLRRIGLWDEARGKGRCAGKQGNRVKAIRLRGVVSQGLLYPAAEVPDSGGPDSGGVGVAVGADVAGTLGITKYEPPIPVHMSGEVANVRGHTLDYDIESLQKFPGILEDGEEVVFSEKLHGTWTCFGFDPCLEHDELLEGGTIISSKGLSSTGLVFKWNEANAENLYVRIFRKLLLDTGLWTRIVEAARSAGEPLYLLGETFGRKVQDLEYGQATPAFRAFDLYRGAPRVGRFESRTALFAQLADWGIESVPVLYRGPFSMTEAEKWRDGRSTLTDAHVREGIVITPAEERSCPKLPMARVQLKLVSPDYLLRRGKTTDFV